MAHRVIFRTNLRVVYGHSLVRISREETGGGGSDVTGSHVERK